MAQSSAPPNKTRHCACLTVYTPQCFMSRVPTLVSVLHKRNHCVPHARVQSGGFSDSRRRLSCSKTHCAAHPVSLQHSYIPPHYKQTCVSFMSDTSLTDHPHPLQLTPDPLHHLVSTWMRQQTAPLQSQTNKQTQDPNMMGCSSTHQCILMLPVTLCCSLQHKLLTAALALSSKMVVAVVHHHAQIRQIRCILCCCCCCSLLPLVLLVSLLPPLPLVLLAALCLRAGFRGELTGG